MIHSASATLTKLCHRARICSGVTSARFNSNINLKSYQKSELSKANGKHIHLRASLSGIKSIVPKTPETSKDSLLPSPGSFPYKILLFPSAISNSAAIPIGTACFELFFEFSSTMTLENFIGLSLENQIRSKSSLPSQFESILLTCPNRTQNDRQRFAKGIGESGDL